MSRRGRVRGNVVGVVVAALCASATLACAPGADAPAHHPTSVGSRVPPKQKATHKDKAKGARVHAPLPRDVVKRHAHGFRGVRTSDGAALDSASLLDAIAGYDAICFGESHSDPAHHWAQWTALGSLMGRGRPLALGLEMFQLPYQAPLTDYEHGRIDEDDLLARTEYATRWGFDYNLYRPLLDTAARGDVTLLALNTPRELTKAVARGGIDGLDEAQRAALPELDMTRAAHRAYFDAAMGGHPMGDMNVEHFYAAQVVWDETMAQTAATWLTQETHSDATRRQILIVAGAGHCHREAIPERIERRGAENTTPLTAVAITPVLASDLGKETADGSGDGRYDLLWVIEGE